MIQILDARNQILHSRENKKISERSIKKREKAKSFYFSNYFLILFCSPVEDQEEN